MYFVFVKHCSSIRMLTLSLVLLSLLTLRPALAMPPMDEAATPPPAAAEELTPVEVKAIVRISYTDHRNHSALSVTLGGLFGLSSRMAVIRAEVIHVRSKFGQHDGCGEILDWNIPPDRPWIALVVRGQCSFQLKLENLARKYNASAVVVYDNEEANLFIIKHTDLGIVSVLISEHDGEFIAELFDNGVTVHATLTSVELQAQERAQEAERTLVLTNTVVRRRRTVLAVSWLVIGGVGVAFLVLLVQALRVVRAGNKRSKARQQEGGCKASWGAVTNNS